MSKKYLLYIHPEEFEKEPKKSALVNQLLCSHYDLNGEPQKLTPAKKPRSVGPANDMKKVIERNQVTTLADGSKAIVIPFTKKKPKVADGTTTLKEVPQVFNILPTDVPLTPEEANDPNSPAYSASVRPDRINVTRSILESCEGHAMRWDCGKKGCKYA